MKCSLFVARKLNRGISSVIFADDLPLIMAVTKSKPKKVAVKVNAKRAFDIHASKALFAGQDGEI